MRSITGGGKLSHRSSTDWPVNNHVHKSYGAKLDLSHLTKTSLIFKPLAEDCFKDFYFILLYLKESNRPGPFFSLFHFLGGAGWGWGGGCDFSEYLSLPALLFVHQVTERDIVLSSALRSWTFLPQGPARGEVTGGRSHLDPRRHGTKCIGFRFHSARSGWKLLFSPGASVSDGEK